MFNNKVTKNVSRASASVGKRTQAGCQATSFECESIPGKPQPPIDDVEYIYQQYLKAFKKGVYNYIKEAPVMSSPNASQGLSSPNASVGDPGHDVSPRKYFSGGVMAKYQIGEDLAMVGPESMILQWLY